ncbi:LuxR C-terminal-related transcriptional regulator [Streptomyces sp. MN03-5084-2B]|nr:LuxR C-terminal-related transcriptional regulator [Streptomyces sp. MN03-5084-2B]
MTESSVEPATSRADPDARPAGRSTSATTAEMTSFVGRGDLIDEAKDLLASARLVTLFGVGGVGKSRLLHRLADELDAAGAYPDGVWVVRLDDVSAQGDLAAAACADQLGILDNADGPALGRLVEFFRERRALLMLDNCEHLVDDASGPGQVPHLLATLLPEAPGLTAVATSRVRLAVSGEHVLKVHPLRPMEALHLLRDRARAAGKLLSDAERELALRLCAMLDGLPLAIELAAGQLDVMPALQEIVEHPTLLNLLVGGPSEQRHHRTMNAAIAWSYDLLGAVEQRLLALVSVFEGGFDLDAATAVCADNGIDPSDVPELLASLVRKSLLSTEAVGGRTRYRMLELIKQFGLRVVEASGEEPAIRDAHARHFLAVAARARQRWFGPGQPDVLLRLRAEFPNARIAQQHLLSTVATEGQGTDLAVDLTSSCAFVFAGVQADSRRMLARGLDRHPAEPSHRQLAALCLISWMAQIQGSDVAAAAQAEAEEIARRLGAESFGPLLFSRGTRLWLAEPDPDRARDSIDLLARAEEDFRTSGEAGLRFMAALYGGMSTAFFGSAEEAFAAGERVLQLATAAEAQWSISWAEWTCALAKLLHQDTRAAAKHAQTALDIQLKIGDKGGPPWSVFLLALIAMRLGDYERGAQLLGGARVAQRLTQTSVLGLERFLRVQQQIEAVARKKFPEFDAKVREGKSLAKSMDAVHKLAMKSFGALDDTPAGTQAAEILTKRELEVAELVAKAMTNPQIGEALRISPRTVEKHVENILLKWGLTSRTEIAIRYLRVIDPAH